MAAFTAAGGSQQPPSLPERGRGGQPVVDEFTAPAEKSGFLERSRASIQRLFRVRLLVLGALSNSGGSAGWAVLEPDRSSSPLGQPQQQAGRRIWLSLQGELEDVRSAKEYIKGLCEPELEEREHYPKDMHCIFVGAQNFFLNCLIHGTCADITVVEIGTLYIKGGAEPVVMARSHIQQFVSLFKNNTSLSDGGESEVKKRFRNLVEIHADKYTMDLLILPSSLKRELLNLAQNEGHKTEDNSLDLLRSDGAPELFPNEIQKRPVVNSDCSTHREEARNNASTPVTELAKQMDNVFPDDPDRHFLPINGLSSLETSASKERQSCKRRSSDAEERLPKKQFSLESNQDCKRTACSSGIEIVDLTVDSSSGSDGQDLDTKEGEEISEEMEYTILVNFFKSMGYSQQIVEKVIGDLGQQAEPLLLLEEIVKESKKKGPEEELVALVSPATESWAEKDKDGVRRRDPQGLGHKVEPPRNEIPNRGPVAQAPSKVVGKVPTLNCKTQMTFSVTKNSHSKDDWKTCTNHSEQSAIPQSSEFESDGHMNACDSTQRIMSDRKQKDHSLVARGSSETLHCPTQKETMVLQPRAAKHNNQGFCNPLPLGMRQPSSPKATQLLDPVQPSRGTAPYGERRTGGSYSRHADPPVTGVQRFLESLKTPYKLELKNEPGRERLKYIVIDGSNVAISHGLQKFFSCRGIAIAVEYFWKRGHRKITVFVPQWRTRRDSNITEQHFLTQLQDIGILALTPARVVFGNRIASHDDRFLLHLAEKTGGVIVTNDNLREFVDESVSWREIIQKRLLPYTFAGDIFMIPDDPLGRKGPGLDRFLQEEIQFRGVPPPYGLASGGPPPLGMPHFLLQPNSSGPLPKSPLPGIVPALTGFPPAPQANSALPPHPRSATETSHLKEALKKIFPTSEQREKIEQILAHHPHMRDLNALSAMVLDLS